MADRALKDDNFVNTITGVLNTDGDTVVAITANPSTHALSVSDGTVGTDLGPSNALKDANNVSTVMAVSNSDGVTPVVLYTNSDGAILIQTT